MHWEIYHKDLRSWIQALLGSAVKILINSFEVLRTEEANVNQQSLRPLRIYSLK